MAWARNIEVPPVTCSPAVTGGACASSMAGASMKRLSRTASRVQCTKSGAARLHASEVGGIKGLGLSSEASCVRGQEKTIACDDCSNWLCKPCANAS